jgi:anti-sigma factor RsiW
MTDPSLIHAYADGELEESERARIATQIAHSPESVAQLKAIEFQKDLLRAKIEPLECADVWQTCRGRLQAVRATRRTETFVGRYAWAVCALFFIAILGGGAFNRQGAGGSFLASDVPQIASNLVPFAAPTSNTPSEVRRWLYDAIGANPPVALQPEMRVVDAAEATVNGGRVLRIRLYDGLGYFALMVVPNVTSVGGVEPLGDGKFFAGQVEQVPCVAWTSDGYGLILFGDRSTAELRDIASRIDIR